MKRPSLTAVVPTGWRSVAPSERREAVNTAFVERARLKGISDAMNKLRRDFREKSPTRCMVVVGEPGVGKSTLLERYRDDARIPEIVTDTHVRRPKPVIYVELPSDATVNVCSDAILSEIMGQAMHSNGRSKEGTLVEGVEDGLSLQRMFVGASVWATLGAGNLPHVVLPPGVRRVVLAGDDDAPGRAAVEAARIAYEAQDRAVSEIFPRAGCRDFNEEWCVLHG